MDDKVKVSVSGDPKISIVFGETVTIERAVAEGVG